MKYHTPTVFEIILKKESIKKLDLRPEEIPFGTTDKRVLFHNNEHLGTYYELEEYHKIIGIDIQSNFGIQISIDQNRQNKLKELEAFIIRLTEFLELDLVKFLIFEHDCEQEELINWNPTIQDLNNNILTYFETGNAPKKSFIVTF